jgi:hypothetical protein
VPAPFCTVTWALPMLFVVIPPFPSVVNAPFRYKGSGVPDESLGRNLSRVEELDLYLKPTNKSVTPLLVKLKVLSKKSNSPSGIANPSTASANSNC